MLLHTKVERDGSGSVAVRIQADREILDLLAQQGVDDPFAQVEEEFAGEWQTAEGEEEDGSRWFLAERGFADPEEFAALGRLLQGEADGPQFWRDTRLEQERSLFVVRTVFTATADLAAFLEAAGGGLGGEEIDPSLLGTVVSFENRVTLPGSIDDTNAPVVEGDTAVWSPDFSAAAEMRAESVAYRWEIIVLPAAGAGILLLAGVGWFVLRRRRAARPQSPPAWGTPKGGGA